jgi:hypothetical protein
VVSGGLCDRADQNLKDESIPSLNDKVASMVLLRIARANMSSWDVMSDLRQCPFDFRAQTIE